MKGFFCPILQHFLPGARCVIALIGERQNCRIFLLTDLSLEFLATIALILPRRRSRLLELYPPNGNFGSVQTDFL